MNISKLLITFMISMIALTISACGGDDVKSKKIMPIGPKKPEIPEIMLCQNVGCESTNKLVIEQIYNDIINGGNTGLVTSLFQEGFVNHNTSIAAGITGQEAFYTSLITNNPENIATIKHIVADGDYVAIHWHYSTTPENEFLGTARIDLYKLADNLIVEYWNKTMKIKATSASGNSVFSDLYDYGSTQPNNNVELEEDNKVMVTDFYLDVFNNKNLGLVGSLMDENYIQHNHWVETGREAFFDFVSNRSSGGLTIHLSLAEDDMVWTFSGTRETNLRTVDLWRVDNNTNKIVEHWDVL